MQFLTAKTVLSLRLAGLVTACFLLLKDPLTLVNANLTVLLGRAMHLPIVQASPKNPLFGVMAMALALLVIGDLVPVLADNVAYFETLVPVRLLFFFALASFCMVSDYAAVANNLVFSYLFMEIWLNFLVFNNLRDEKYYRAKEYLETHGTELRDMADAQVLPIGNDR